MTSPRARFSSATSLARTLYRVARRLRARNAGRDLAVAGTGLDQSATSRPLRICRRPLLAPSRAATPWPRSKCPSPLVGLRRIVRAHSPPRRPRPPVLLTAAPCLPLSQRSASLFGHGRGTRVRWRASSRSEEGLGDRRHMDADPPFASIRRRPPSQHSFSTKEGASIVPRLTASWASATVRDGRRPPSPRLRPRAAARRNWLAKGPGASWIWAALPGCHAERASHTA